MSSEPELPPPHVLSIQRLAALTARGASAHLVENQVAAMLAAWTTELGGDRSEFRDRLNGMEENLQSGLEQTQEALGGIEGDGRTVAERQVVALKAALDAVRQAQDRLGA